MVIKLEGADFSANNIGKVVIAEISEFTKAAIEASGNTSMSANQKLALEVFFDTIGAKDNSGVAAKIERLYIPLINGGNLATALVNYKDNVVDSVLDSNNYQMRNRGVAGLLESPSAITSVAKTSTIVDSKDFSFFIGFNENFDNGGRVAYIASYNGNSGNNRFYLQTTTGSADGNATLYKTHISPSGLNMLGGNSDYSSIAFKTFGMSSVANTNDMLFENIFGEFSTKTYSALANIGQDTTPSDLMLFVNASKVPMKSNAPAVGMLMFGKGMTEQEMRTFKMAADTLAEAFA